MGEHPIPFAALDEKIGVLGVTGSGKTFTAIGLVEQLLEAGRQTIIVDPTGAYSGLRTAFPIPIFGGKFGDVPIAEGDGEAIARWIVDSGSSAIVDVSALLKESHASARRFMRPFVATLKNSPTAARYMVMDEADEFMPEHASGDSTQLFGDLKWIVRRGRIEGWRMLMVTQRPQDIAKSVLTQCQTLVLHQLTAPQDRRAVEEWVKGNANNAEAKQVLDSLASLETGEAWVWSPKNKLLVRTKMPANRSADRSKTPDAADAPRARSAFKAVDVSGLAKQLDKARGAIETEAAPKVAQDAEVASLRGAEVRQLREQLNASVALAEIAETSARRWKWRAEHAASILVDGLHRDWPGGLPEFDEVPGGSERLPERFNHVLAAEHPEFVERVSAAVAERRVYVGEPDLSQSAQKMMATMKRVYPRRLNMRQTAMLSGVSIKSSGLPKYWKELEASSFVEIEDGLARSKPADGEVLDHVDPLKLWMGLVKPPEARLLRAIAEHGPLNQVAAAGHAGISPTSSALPASLKRLVSYGLVRLGSGKRYELAEDLRA